MTTTWPSFGSYLAATILPIAGLILPIIHWHRDRVGSGLALMMTSWIGAGIWAGVAWAIIAHQAQTDMHSFAQCIHDAQTYAQAANCN